MALQAGIGRYTWQSFNIKKYCESVNMLLRKLQSMVSQINYIRVDIRSRIEQMKKFNFFTLESSAMEREPQISFNADHEDSVQSSAESDIGIHKVKIIHYKPKKEVVYDQRDICGDGVYHCQGYMDRLEQYRTQQCSAMKRHYDSLGPELVKLESLVLGTFTGRSEKMRDYYTFWEEQAYKCLLE